MATISLHDVTGKIFEVDTRTFIECVEFPGDYTEIVALRKVHDFRRVNPIQRETIRVQESKAEMRQKILKHSNVVAAMPLCLTRDRITFEQLRAARRRREAEATTNK